MKWFFGKKRTSGDIGWFRSKHLKVEGPDFWGKFDVYIDRNLHIAIFLPKADHSVHVLRGTVERATLHYTYSATGRRTSAVTLFSDQIQWHLSPTEIQFHGLRLPDARKRYRAEVSVAEPFEDTIDQAWITQTLTDMQAQMAAASSVTVEPDSTPDAFGPEEELQRFTQLIRVHEDQAFGLRLLFTAFKRQLIPPSEVNDVLVDSYPALRQQETETVAGAKRLLKQFHNDKASIDDLKAYEFPAIQGNATQNEITAQAQIFVDTYEDLFAGRNRGAFLSKQDHQRLAEEARKKLRGLKVPYPIEDYRSPAKKTARARTEEMQSKT